MKEKLAQNMEQKLQQRLTPMQMRLVRMLEMSEPEIEDEVRKELDDNPALAEADTLATQSDDAATGNEDFNETSEEMQLADYREDEIPTYRLEARNRSVNDEYLEPVAVAGGDSLFESLMHQLSETDLTDRQLSIARYVVGNIDDNGYITRSLQQIQDDFAIESGVDVPMDELKTILERIRSLDPAGVGAYDLRDCLLLQLDRLPDSEAVRTATTIVKDYFDLYSRRHFERLLGLMDISRDELKEADQVIRGLNPKPAGLLGESEAETRQRHIVPDFYVDVDQEDRITVVMPSHVPELAIERSFDVDETVPASGVGDSASSARTRTEALAFISKKRQEASEFIELLRMRRETLIKVMESIARWQARFFATEDESCLRPMVLRDISSMTGLDISVISRATTGKYVATHGAVYPLKFFFNEKINESVDASQHEIISAIKTLIDEEDASSPLSDDSITERLRGIGYDIARRTVAKYRERLGIPVAKLRKKI